MKFSVIIPVRTVTDYLKETVSHLKKVKYYDFEVIIVFDEETKVNFGLRETRFKAIAAGGPLSPGEKRNLGAREATGDVLAFIDDDAYPDIKWLRSAANIFEEKPDLYALGGPAVTPEGIPVEEEMAGRVLESYLSGAFTTYRHKASKRKEIDDFPSVNLFVKKDAFLEVGGFDKEFWPGEDTKLCLDLVSKFGRKFLYDPKPVVYHHRRALFAPFLEQIGRYGRHRGHFAKIFPQNSRKLAYFVPSLFVLWAVFGLVFSVIFFRLFPYYSMIWFLYLTLVFAESQRVSMNERDFSSFKYMFLGIVKTHFIYGINFMKGFFSKPKFEVRSYDESTGNYQGG